MAAVMNEGVAVRDAAQALPRRAFRRHALDVVLVVVLAGVGAWAGAAYYKAAPAPFFQGEFGPAVLEACGRAYMNPAPNAVPALAQFLAQQRKTFDCAELPPTLALGPPTDLQYAFRYLMSAMAIYWRATGISWDHLSPIFGAMHGVVAGLSYLAFRVVMARLLAALLGLAVAFSAVQLSLLPYLRDSTKTPFFTALALIALLVWTRPLTTRMLLLLCGSYGVISGIAVGFRPDVVMWFPMLAIAIVCARHASLRERMKTAVVGLSAAIGLFVLFGLPILAQYRSGSNLGHVALLGYTEPFDPLLGVRRGPYTLGPSYDDSYIYSAIVGYARRVHGFKGELRSSSTEYERFGTKYYLEMVRTFPADFATRVGASVAQVLNLPFARRAYGTRAGIEAVPFLRDAVGARDRVLGVLDGWGPLIVLVAFALLAIRGVTFAVGFAATVLYLASVPVLQFNLRHYQHLECLGLFALGVIVQAAGGGIRSALRPETRAQWTRASSGWAAARVAVCASVIVVIPLGSIKVLRAYQQAAVGRLFDRYNAQASELLPYSAQPDAGGRVLVVPQGMHLISTRELVPTVMDDYLAVDLNNACDAILVTMRIKYETNLPPSDFTRDVTVRLWPAREYGSARLFLPIYQLDVAGLGNKFQGLELTADDFPCFGGLWRVRDSTSTPLRLNVLLNRNWRDQPLYQTFADPGRVDSKEAVLYRSPPSLAVRSARVASLSGIAGTFKAASKITRIEAAATVDGVAEGPFGYLMVSTPAAVAADGQVIASGELFEGGFTFGLQKDDQWSQTINITEPGRFLVAVGAPTDGTYVVVIANYQLDTDTTRRTRFVINGFSWAPAASPAPGGGSR